MQAHAHMHIYTCIEIANGPRHGGMHGTPPNTPIPTPTVSTHLSPPRGVDPRNHLKFDKISTYQDISIPFEDLKSVQNSPPMGGVWFGGWVGGWVGSGQITKNLKIVD